MSARPCEWVPSGSCPGQPTPEADEMPPYRPSGSLGLPRSAAVCIKNGLDLPSVLGRGLLACRSLEETDNPLRGPFPRRFQGCLTAPALGAGTEVPTQ